MTRKANCSRCRVARAKAKFNRGDTYCVPCRSIYNSEQYAEQCSVEKTCTKCDVSKPASEFAFDGRRRRNDCKECQREYQRTRREGIGSEEGGKVYDFSALAQHWRVNESRGGAS